MADLHAGSLTQFLENTKGKSFEEARKMAQEDYDSLQVWIEAVERVQKRKPKRESPGLWNYLGDLTFLIDEMDEQPSLARGYTLRLIEEALKRWGRTDKNG